jgi:hypothetical protein
LSAQEPTNMQRAMEYYKHAAEFTDAYNKLSKVDNDQTAIAKDLMQASVKQLILGHALELVMKGWLVLYEGSPVSLTKKARKKLEEDGYVVPMTLKDYGHDLEKLASAAVNYDPGLQPYMDKTIPMVDETGMPVLDGKGHQRRISLIEHLNSSYWAGGARQYEYPEASEAAVRKSIAFLSPLDKFAKFVSTSRHKLLEAIQKQNGGTIPLQYRRPSNIVNS